MSAMLKLRYNQRIHELGWKQILQIHDEIILEGPQESADEVLKIVQDVMSNPFSNKLKIDLIVDGRKGKNWYECK
jgi:DNA polymerase I